MTTAETRPGVEEKKTEEFMLVWNIGLEARSVLPDDVREISQQVLRWMNPEQEWQLRRITAKGYSATGKPLASEKLEQYLTGKTLSADPWAISFIFHLRAAKPPEIYEKRRLFRSSKFNPQTVFGKAVTADTFSVSSTYGQILKLPDTPGPLRSKDPLICGANERYYFLQAHLILNHVFDHPNMESSQHAAWQNITLQVEVGNTYSGIALKIEKLKFHLAVMETEETQVRTGSTSGQNISPKSS